MMRTTAAVTALTVLLVLVSFTLGAVLGPAFARPVVEEESIPVQDCVQKLRAGGMSFYCTVDQYGNSFLTTDPDHTIRELTHMTLRTSRWKGVIRIWKASRNVVAPEPSSDDWQYGGCFFFGDPELLAKARSILER